MYGKLCKRDWKAKVVFLTQMLLTFGGRCNRYFWDMRLKMLRLPNFNMRSQLVLTKFFKSELFSCLLKVDHMIKSCREPIFPVSPTSDLFRTLTSSPFLSRFPLLGSHPCHTPSLIGILGGVGWGLLRSNSIEGIYMYPCTEIFQNNYYKLKVWNLYNKKLTKN